LSASSPNYFAACAANLQIRFYFTARVYLEPHFLNPTENATKLLAGDGKGVAGFLWGERYKNK
jgi:hypothetical protein